MDAVLSSPELELLFEQTLDDDDNDDLASFLVHDDDDDDDDGKFDGSDEDHEFC